MVAFASAIEDQLDGPTVRYADLVRFSFKSGEVRAWGGFGTLIDGNGEEWDGLNGMGRLSSVSSGPGQAIEELTLSLFGTTAMLARIEADTEEAVGRDVVRYVQFLDVRKFDDVGNFVEWQPVDVPSVVFWGTMGAPFVDRPEVAAGSAGGSRVVSIKAVNAFLNRRKPSLSYFSHRDQDARHPGDNIFIRASRMADATVNWPVGVS